MKDVDMEQQEGGRLQPSTSTLRATPTQQEKRRHQRKTHSPYPKSSPRTPIRGGASSDLVPQAPPQSPQSPSMRAFSAIVGMLTPFGSSRQTRKSAAFGEPQAEEGRSEEDSEEEEEGEDGIDGENGKDERGEQSIYPSLPQAESPLASSILPPAPAAAAVSNMPPRQSLFSSSSAFSAPRQSTPSKSGFATLAASAPRQVLPPSTPAFTFGNPVHAAESFAPTLPAYPRPSGRPQLSSPLAKNYDLLARFFTEKAEQEGRGDGDSSAASMQDGDMGTDSGGLTEIEVAGCMRLIEESLAQGRAGELDRLRGVALEGATSMDPVSPHYTERSFLSRSPSLPLGAAAGEMPVEYGLRARPSSSFLSPSYSRSDDSQINRSLATTFAPSSAPAKRRHRPLYLGPGQGASAAASLMQRNKQMQQMRSSRLSRPVPASSRPMAAPSWLQEEHDEEDRDASGSNAKKRRVNEGEAQAKSLPPSQILPSMPSRRPADTPPIAPKPAATPPSRTATADAMLSILSAGPSIAVRRTVPREETMVEQGTSPARFDVVNPYQTRSRSTKRSTIAGGLAAKEKERLREEREKKQKQMEGSKVKESLLDMIERTAPTQGSKRGSRRGRVEEEERESERERKEEQQRERQEARRLEEEQAEAQRRSKETEARRAEEQRAEARRAEAKQAEARRAEEKKRKEGEEERKRKTEEVRKRMDKLASQTASSNQAASESTEPVGPRKSFASASAFAPKKPSPLSQANTMAPDSPSSSSEASEREAVKPFAFHSPSATVAPAKDSTGSTVPTLSTPSDARTEALQVAPASLPKFDFAMDVVLSNHGPLSDKESRQAAKEKDSAQLPVFDLIGASSSATTPAKAAATAPPTSSLSFGAPGSASTTAPSAFSFGSPASEPARGGESAAGPETEGETKSADSSVSALLSGSGEGEEEEESLHEVRCKVWNLKAGSWADLGIGQFKVKRNKVNGKKRVLVRNEGNGKVVVNFRLLPSFKPIGEKNVVSFLGFDGEGRPTNYRCKVKTDAGASELAKVLEREAVE